MAESFTVTREWMMMLRSLPTDRAFVNVVSALADYALDGKDADGLSEDEKRVFMIIRQRIKSRKCKANYLRKKRAENSTVESTVESMHFELERSTVESTVESTPSDELPLNIEENQGIFKQDNTIDSSKVLKKEKEIKSSTNSFMRETDKSSPEKRKIFVPPTLEEVREYCKYRRNAVNPDEFHAFYESKGWLVGKTKMKDWKAAVRYWEQKMYEDRKSLSQKRDYSGI